MLRVTEPMLIQRLCGWVPAREGYSVVLCHRSALTDAEIQTKSLNGLHIAIDAQSGEVRRTIAAEPEGHEGCGAKLRLLPVPFGATQPTPENEKPLFRRSDSAVVCPVCDSPEL